MMIAEMLKETIESCEKYLDKKEINFASVKDISVDDYKAMLLIKANAYDFIKEMLKESSL